MLLSRTMSFFIIFLFFQTQSARAAILAPPPPAHTIESAVVGGRIDALPDNSSYSAPLLQNLTITDSFTVLGTSLFGQTSIAGGITIDGTISLDSHGIQNLGDTLYLSPNRLAPIDLMGGALRIMPDGSADFSGNVKIQGNLEAKKLLFSPSDQSNVLGVGMIPAGQTATQLFTDAVTENSYIFVTPSTVSAQPLSVTHSSPPTDDFPGSFTVETATPVPSDLDFHWFIVN